MALDKTKTDPAMGQLVSEMLIEKGVETPMTTFVRDYEDKYEGIKNHVQDIMMILGLDLDNDSLSGTPKRIASMYLNEIFWGLNYDNFPKITTIENRMKYDTMLLERHIRVNTQCEHHFLPFIGEAYVAYIPNDCIIGLSKINRIVEFFCRRPQVQERLCEQIFHTICEVLNTEDVAVLITAEHSCVKLRGVEDTNSDTVTTKLGGIFLDNITTRNEFFQSIKL